MTVSNKYPVYVHHPETTRTDIPATANTNLDGTGTITNIYTANAAVNGSLVEVIKFIATASNSAGYIRLYRSAGGGTSWKLIGQVAVAAFTPSATVATAESFYVGLDMPLRLNAGDTLGAAPTQANSFSCLVLGGPLVNSDA